jgi:hypothetical protein
MTPTSRRAFCYNFSSSEAALFIAVINPEVKRLYFQRALAANAKTNKRGWANAKNKQAANKTPGL